MRRGSWTWILLVLSLASVPIIVLAPVAEARITCFGRKPTITGTARSELIRGTPNRDVIAAMGGNDVIKGLGGNDVICGFKGADEVLGGAGDDTLSGDDGADIVNGGLGSDFLLGREGDDTLNGGDGIDLASWVTADGGVTVDLTAGTAAGEGSDTVEGVEDVFGSKFDDMLTGDGGANLFFPHGGDDAVDGAGALNDRVDYLFSSNGVVVDLSTGTATGQGSDTLTGIEDVSGSKLDDTFTGDAGANVLIGRDGADTIQGGDGDDSLFGGAGDDSLDGGIGTDSLDGGAGTDTCTNGEDNANCEA